MKTALLTLPAVASTLKQLIIGAEAMLPGSTGAEKRAFVVATLNEKYDLPWLSESQEAQLFGFGFDLLVSTVKG